MAFQTLVVSKTIWLRPGHNKEEVPHSFSEHHTKVKQMYKNIFVAPQLRRRAPPPQNKPLSPKSAVLDEEKNNRAGRSESWVVIGSARTPRTTHARAEGNRLASLSSSHDSYSSKLPSNHVRQLIVSNDMRSSASVENDSTDGVGAVEAQGPKLKFKSSTSIGNASLRVYGPGSMTAVQETTLAQHNSSPSIERIGLTTGEKQDFKLQPHSKLTGEMHSDVLDQPLPKIEGALAGKGKMTVKAKDA